MAVLALSLALPLAACGLSGPTGGVASYDALRQATDACKAKGGTLVLQKDADPQDINNYACERQK